MFMYPLNTEIENKNDYTQYSEINVSKAIAVEKPITLHPETRGRFRGAHGADKLLVIFQKKNTFHLNA